MDTTKIDLVRFSEARLHASKTYYPTSSEAARLEFIVNDLKSKLTPDEFIAYSTKTAQSEADIEADRIATVKAMNENRDKNSI